MEKPEHLQVKKDLLGHKKWFFLTPTFRGVYQQTPKFSGLQSGFKDFRVC